MATNPPASGTTDDTLLNGAVIFRQPASGYRAAIDPVLLAASIPDPVSGRVLDLGCGAGAAMLCLARRRADLHEALTEVGFGGAGTTPLWPKIGMPPKRSIVAAQRGSKEPARSGNGLVLHELDGRFTGPATAILRDGVKLSAV